MNIRLKVISAAALCCVLFVGNASALSIFGKYTAVEPEKGIVSLPLEEVGDGDIHYFKYDHQGREIRFFVVKSTDGEVRAAFDACDVCFPAKKGYSKDGEYVICNNCGRRFHTTNINVVSGGCNPAPLKRSFTDSELRIAVKDIVAGASYF